MKYLFGVKLINSLKLIEIDLVGKNYGSSIIRVRKLAKMA